MKPSGAGAPSLKRYAMASSMSRLASSRGMTGFDFNCGRQLSALCGPAKLLEVGFIRRCRRRRGRAFEQQAPHALAVLIFANQLPHVFAARAVAAQRLNLASEIRWYGPGKLLVIVDCVESL